MSYAAREITHLLFSFLPVFLSCLFPPNHHTVSLSVQTLDSCQRRQPGVRLTSTSHTNFLGIIYHNRILKPAVMRRSCVSPVFTSLSAFVPTQPNNTECVLPSSRLTLAPGLPKREGFRSLQSHLTSTSSSTIFFFHSQSFSSLPVEYKAKRLIQWVSFPSFHFSLLSTPLCFCPVLSEQTRTLSAGQWPAGIRKVKLCVSVH